MQCYPDVYKRKIYEKCLPQCCFFFIVLCAELYFSFFVFTSFLGVAAPGTSIENCFVPYCKPALYNTVNTVQFRRRYSTRQSIRQTESDQANTLNQAPPDVRKELIWSHFRRAKQISWEDKMNLLLVRLRSSWSCHSRIKIKIVKFFAFLCKWQN